ncbi:MAG TPA: stage III sporulation protein AA [Clostridiaceae bacterium]|nr:stage III sporulation protein AA [Clostridiaceae bacterium]
MVSHKRKSNIYEGFLFDILPCTPLEIRMILNKLEHRIINELEEIRLRAERPLIIRHKSSDWIVDINGYISKECNNAYIVKQEQILKTVEILSQNSIYAFLDEIKCGFITIRGGHRVGITGRTVLEGQSVKNIKDISGLNFRISKEIKGCSDNYIGYLINEKKEVTNTLIVSPPGCGKTTMLRDLARNLGNGIKKHGIEGLRVGIVDERSEIAACYKGVASHDVGIRTDVLDGCPKSVGMVMMLRSMSPDVIITDEIGNEGDREAVLCVINAGVKIISTAHGYSISDLKSRKEVLKLIEDKVFERYLVLGKSKGPGIVVEIVDGLTMKKIYPNPKET